MKNRIYTGKSINNLHTLGLIPANAFVVIDKNLQNISDAFDGLPKVFVEFSEERKVLSTVEQISLQLLNLGADRDALIIGVGGGIATDITGFAASIYKRGVKFAFVPTTLLSQADASIGGKNGVNFFSYKNILGTITQPEWIYICPELLATLPQEEFKAGIAEVLKTFILFDREYYRKAVEYFSTVAKLYGAQETNGVTYGKIATDTDMDLLCKIIGKCAEYKNGVVERDEFEKGERRLLNLGHTFAHAIEKLASGEIPHGYAVAIGLVIAAQTACSMGFASSEFVQMLAKDLRSTGLPASPEEYPATAHLNIAQLAEAIGKDKKVTGDSIHLILPKGLEDVEDVVVGLETIKEICNDMC